MISRTLRIRHSRPRLLMAYADSSHAAFTSRQFRRQGWEVHLVNAGADARRMACLLHPQLVLLDADLPDESGWLTCAKLLQETPDQRVYIVGAEQRCDSAAFSAYIGAAGYICRDESHYLIVDDECCRDVSVAV